MDHLKYIYQTERSEFPANTTINMLDVREHLARKTCPFTKPRDDLHESIDLKPITLIADRPSSVIRVLWASPDVSILSYLTIKPRLDEAVRSARTGSKLRRRCPAVIKQLFHKRVYVCIAMSSLQNAEYVLFLKDFRSLQKDSFSLGWQPIAALLTDGSEALPAELNGYLPIPMDAGAVDPDAFCQFLENVERERLQRIESALKVPNDAGLKIMIKVSGDQFPNASYLKKAYEAILETFDDAATYPRQYFLQLLNIPNVRTLRYESKPDSLEAFIEIQPNSTEDLQHFLDCHSSGEFLSMLQNNVKVNGASFVGRMEVCVDTEDCQQRINATTDAPTAAGQHHARVRRLTAMCATEILQRFLDKRHLSAFHYLRTVKKAGCPDFLTQIRTSEGYNALHLAVRYESEELMKLIFYANKWGSLRSDFVKPTNLVRGSLHAGYTPRRLVEALAYRDSGYSTLTIFEQYDGLYTRMPSIHKACLAGSVPLAAALLDADPSLIEENDDDGANCLLYASASGDAKLVDDLLTKGVPSNTQNKAGETPCHLAVMSGHLAVLERLSEHFFDIRGAGEGRGYSALHYGARYGDLDALQFYKDKGFRFDGKALAVAAKYRQSDAFRFILDAVTDVNGSSDVDGRSALHHSALNGDVCAVKRLLERGADLTLVDGGGRNAFHSAAEAGCEEVARILVDEAKRVGRLSDLVSAKDFFLGEDLMTVIRGKDRGRRAWHIVELDRLRVRAFREAMRSGRLDVGEYGRIVLSGFGMAPDRRTEELMRRRLRDVAAERKPDMTPLHVATLHRRYEVVEVLLRNEARPDDVDHRGATAMHYAAMNDDVRVMELLYQVGASADVKTVDGKSPYDVADDNRSRSATNFFRALKPVRLAKEFADVHLSEVYLALSEDTLDRKRRKGTDLRQYIISILRDLTVNVNILLQQLDSGPIHQVTSD